MSARIELEHVAIGVVWRVALCVEARMCIVQIRWSNENEQVVSAPWCPGRAGHPAHLCIAVPPRRDAEETLADINAKLRDLIAGVEAN